MFTLTAVIVSALIGAAVGGVVGFLSAGILGGNKIDDICADHHIELENLKKEHQEQTASDARLVKSLEDEVKKLDKELQKHKPKQGKDGRFVKKSQ